MAKLGRYSADRKKIQAVAAAETLVVTPADCGTIFTLAGGAGVVSITLPTAAAAGAGWWCKFVLLTNKASNDVTITAGTAGELVVSNFGGLDAADARANVVSDPSHDNIKFKSTAMAGDQIEFISTGSQMLCQAFSAGDGSDIISA